MSPFSDHPTHCMDIMTEICLSLDQQAAKPAFGNNVIKRTQFLPGKSEVSDNTVYQNHASFHIEAIIP